MVRGAGWSGVRLHVAVMLACATVPARADSPESRALPAVAALLAASALPVAAGSTCYGILPGVAAPTLGALVASRLAYLNGGRNEVAGGCGEGGDASRCRVTMRHSDGEDVASADFRFRVVDGRLDPASLVCAFTP